MLVSKFLSDFKFCFGSYVMLFCSICKFFFVALEDLSETQRELVDSCFYSRGVSLNYHQTWVMSRQLFDDNYILCTPFVHRFDSMNVNGQHMVSFVFGYCVFICSLLQYTVQNF